MKLDKGYLQIYTGNGKGKTTAALGLGLRAAGNGLKVIMVQLLKGGPTGELKAVKALEPLFQIYRFEKERGFFWTLKENEKKELSLEIKLAMNFCSDSLKNRNCDILIIDEIFGALSNKLISNEDVLKLLKDKKDDTELILTGRNVPDEILEKADLVTEMVDVKHYMNKGVKGRFGIEF